MISTADFQDAAAVPRQQAAAYDHGLPLIVDPSSGAGLPAGTWIRVISQLPVESRPIHQELIPARRLVAGAKVFIDLREGSLQVRGWGIVNRLHEPLGWHVAFADGSAIGMQRSELMKHCWVVDAPRAGWHGYFRWKSSSSPQRCHG